MKAVQTTELVLLGPQYFQFNNFNGVSMLKAEISSVYTRTRSI